LTDRFEVVGNRTQRVRHGDRGGRPPRGHDPPPGGAGAGGL